MFFLIKDEIYSVYDLNIFLKFNIYIQVIILQLEKYNQNLYTNSECHVRKLLSWFTNGCFIMQCRCYEQK